MECTSYIFLLMVIFYLQGHCTSVPIEDYDQIKNGQDLLHLEENRDNPLFKLLAKFLISFDKKIEQKIGTLDTKLNTVENKFSKVHTQFEKLQKKQKSHPGIRRGCSTGKKKDLVTKPVCKFNKCTDWSQWTKCDKETGQQTRTRQCGSDLYTVLCSSKTETDTRRCGSVCKFNKCTDWSQWSECAVYNLGETGQQSRKRHCGSDTAVCSIKTETENKSCESVCKFNKCTDWSEWTECDVYKIGQTATQSRVRQCGLNTTLCSSKTESENKICESVCQFNKCTDWSEWTECDIYKIGETGNQSRMRQCGFDTTLCTSQTETETNICEGFCPNDYEMTQNGFCLKLHENRRSSWYAAEEHCQHDGGHLMHIDSRHKSEEVQEIVGQIWNGFWIDGIQRKPGTSWIFSHGSMNFTFTNWYAGEPGGDLYTPTCMYLEHQTWTWQDYSCSYLGDFMCEIVQNK